MTGRALRQLPHLADRRAAPPRAATLAAGAGPILVIGNERDPATPIGGTKQLAKDLASGVLLTSDHDGHGTYYDGSSCVDSAVDGYLTQGNGAGRRQGLLSRLRGRLHLRRGPVLALLLALATGPRSELPCLRPPAPPQRRPERPLTRIRRRPAPHRPSTAAMAGLR